MFEAAELGRSISKQEFNAQIPELRGNLLETQWALRQSKRSVIILIAGIDGSGRGEVINRLHEWLDPRGVQAISLGRTSDEEEERPPYWRFWRVLPAKGQIGVMFGGWYLSPVKQYLAGEISTSAFEHELKKIASFEKMLADDGTIILKFWYHLSQDEQRKKLKKMDKSEKERWKISPEAWEGQKRYEEVASVWENAIRFTDSGVCPWFLIESSDRRYRDITTGLTLLDALKHGLQNPDGKLPSAMPYHVAPVVVNPGIPSASVTILDHVDLSQKLDTKTYTEELEHYQGVLNRLAQRAYDHYFSTVVVFEGWDAAGKGGNIRRMTSAMDARHYQVIPIAAPTDEERAHHYLWRFWRHIPRAGRFTIYDRSWYGRVLVERVEGFATETEWSRSYLEINEFEEQLQNHNIAVIKFWLHIDPEEQLRRFQERQQVAYKSHKITDEDWRNREKWDAYASAVNDMVARTSTLYAPWTLIAANDKKFARLQTLKTVCDRLEQSLTERFGPDKEISGKPHKEEKKKNKKSKS